MAFLKANLVLIVIGAVSLASIGGGALAFMGGSDTDARMKQVSELLSSAQRLQREAVNKQSIEAKKQEREELKTAFEQSLDAALAMQKCNVFYEEIGKDGSIARTPRELLVANVLPDAKSAVCIQFREAYKREFAKLNQRLRARGGPTAEEIDKQRQLIDQLKNSPQELEPPHPWMPRQVPVTEESSKTPERERSLPELLKEWPQARAADEVARSVYMYVNVDAFKMHDLVKKTDAPGVVEIWQAQMALWIQQDLVTALARCNEERAAQLKQQGVPEPYWVAQMPVKHLKELCIQQVLGKGGVPAGRLVDGWASSFSEVQNDDKLFVVPLQLQLVVEEAALMNVLAKLCSVGFYTPIRVTYRPVEIDPTFSEPGKVFIYGDAPVVEVAIDLEGYYFRQVFEQWIPNELKQILKTPGARDDQEGRG
jgi:hypothetical protein